MYLFSDNFRINHLKNKCSVLLRGAPQWSVFFFSVPVWSAVLQVWSVAPSVLHLRSVAPFSGSAGQCFTRCPFAGLLLQNTYGACFWIFAAANTSFSAESGIYFWQSHHLLLRIPLKTRVVNLRSSHWNSLKNGVLRNFANFTGKHLCKILNSCGI